MTKQVLFGRVFKYSHSLSEFDGRMEDVIQNLIEIKASAEAEGYTDLTMSVDYGYSGDDIDWTVRGNRLETDDEYEARMDMERRIKEQKRKDKKSREERDRKEYERLRKKYEGK
jgi:hypothetical protein